MSKNIKDSFIFYRSFFESISLIDNDSEKLAVFEAICEQGLNNKTPEGLQIKTPIGLAVFNMAKPQLQANYKRYEDGKKGGKFGSLGGRPRKNEKPHKETPNVNVNVNDNVNDNKKEYGINDNVMLTRKEFARIEERYSDYDYWAVIENLSNYLLDHPNKYKSHYTTICNWMKKETPRPKVEAEEEYDEYFDLLPPISKEEAEEERARKYGTA